MPLPKIIVGGKEVKVALRRLTTEQMIDVQLIKLRNAATGLEQVARDIENVEVEEAKVLSKSLSQYRQLVAAEFKEEEKLRAIAAKVLRILRNIRAISIDFSEEIRAGTLTAEKFARHESKLVDILPMSQPLADEFRRFGTFNIYEQKYQEFFEKLNQIYSSRLANLTRRKLGAFAEQRSQLILALKALDELRRLL